MTGKAAAEWVDPDTLVPWRDNPRRKQPVQRVMESIREFGFASPIIARASNREIIIGHTRWAAAKRLRMKTVPVRFLDIDERKAHLLALADNKLGELAEWDEDALRAQLEAATVHELDLAGFDMDDAIVANEEDEAGSELSADLTYQVVIECTDEEQQSDLINRLEGEGLKCRALIL